MTSLPNSTPPAGPTFSTWWRTHPRRSSVGPTHLAGTTRCSTSPTVKYGSRGCCVRDDGVKPVGALLNELFRRKGMKRSLRRAEAVLLWPRIVGADVAKFSTARSVRDGVLFVDVSDSETAMHLSMQRRRFLSAYRDTYGVTDVRDVRFQVGRLGAEPEQEEVDGSGARAVPHPERQ